MPNETRRRIADQVLERMRSRGFPLDRDSELMELIDRWSAGEMEMTECQRQYLALRQQRSEIRRPPPLRVVGPGATGPDTLPDERQAGQDPSAS